MTQVYIQTSDKLPEPALKFRAKPVTQRAATAADKAVMLMQNSNIDINASLNAIIDN